MRSRLNKCAEMAKNRVFADDALCVAFSEIRNAFLGDMRHV